MDCMYTLFLCFTAMVGSECGSVKSVSNASKSNIDRAVYFAERVNTHFDGTINALHHAVLMIGSDSNDTYTFKEVMKEPDFG